MVSKATVRPSGDPKDLEVIVDGDPHYRAGTTRKAIELLTKGYGKPSGRIVLEQSMGVPVGCGFGASAAAAVSAVYAVGSARGLKLPKSELAYFAHVADIVQQTGLGTVSVIYDATGAGAITKAGGPGVSKFINVRVPLGTRIVTAVLAPFRKSDAISDPRTSRRINRLGGEALKSVVATPTLDTLASEGEKFSQRLGLMTPNVEALTRSAIQAGAAHSSQNMIGHAVHSITTTEMTGIVSEALKHSPLRPRVDVYEIGSEAAHAVRTPRTS